MANISTGAAGQVAGLAGLPQLQAKPGILGEIGEFASGVGTAAAASDIRLKKNIHKIGKTSKGFNLYIWDWNAIGQKITGHLSGIGVLAQEVQKIMPEAVVDGGYLHVDYGKVL